MLIVDFKKDWYNYIKNELKEWGFSFQDKDITTSTYFNIKHRLLYPQRPRIIYESKELKIPPEYRVGYSDLKKCIEIGGNLKNYLSRDLKSIKRIKESEFDLQLNEWGITHFHLTRHKKRNREKDDDEDNLVLFGRVTDTDVFFLQILPHGNGYPGVWTNKTLIDILHNNWSKEIEKYKSNVVDGNDLTDKQRIKMRNNHSNVLIKVADGTSYYPFGGGMTANGSNICNLIKEDKLQKNLSDYEMLIKNNEINFRKALNISKDETLNIKMFFSDQECYFYEPKKKVKFSINQDDK